MSHLHKTQINTNTASTNKAETSYQQQSQKQQHKVHENLVLSSSREQEEQDEFESIAKAKTKINVALRNKAEKEAKQTSYQQQNRDQEEQDEFESIAKAKTKINVALKNKAEKEAKQTSYQPQPQQHNVREKLVLFPEEQEERDRLDREALLKIKAAIFPLKTKAEEKEEEDLGWGWLDKAEQAEQKKDKNILDNSDKDSLPHSPRSMYKCDHCNRFYEKKYIDIHESLCYRGKFACVGKKYGCSNFFDHDMLLKHECDCIFALSVLADRKNSHRYRPY